MHSVLRYRGIEAWLEDSNNQPIAFSEDGKIDSHTISTWVNVKPRQYYTLRWRTSAGHNPHSALCEVYVEDDFHSASDDLESPILVSTSIMDATRRVTQNKITKGWLNPPYSRSGYLRIRRRIRTGRDSTKEAKTQPGILLLGSLRLEIRRVSGDIRKDQVCWGKGDDGNDIYVFDPDGIELIDDAARGKPPYITFEFKFREDSQITKITAEEENEDTKIDMQWATPVTQKSHASSQPSTILDWGKVPKFGKTAQRIAEKVDKIGGNHLKNTSSKNGIPDVTPSIGPPTNTSSQPPSLPRHKYLKFTKTAPSVPEKVDKIKDNHLKNTSSKNGIPNVTPSIGPPTQTSSQPPSLLRDKLPNSPKVTQSVSEKVDKIGGNHSSLKITSSKNGIPHVTPSKGQPTQTSLLPLSLFRDIGPKFPKVAQLERVSEKVDKTGGNNLKNTLSKNGKLTLPMTKCIPDVTPSIGPSTHTSLLPPIPRHKIVSNANLVAPGGGLNIKRAASQSKLEVAHPPSSSLPSTTTENVFHAEMILSTESAMPTNSPAPMDGTTTANPGMQIGRSDGELNERLSTTSTEDIVHTEVILSTESVMPTSEPSHTPTSMGRTSTTNPVTQTPVGPSDGKINGRRLGALLLEGMPTGSHSRNSPGPLPTTRERDSHIRTSITVCEQEVTPRINEVQQSSEGGDRAFVTAPTTTGTSNEMIVNAGPDISMDLDLDGKEGPAEVVIKKNSDIAELSTSRKGKRKMVDRGDDANAHVLVGDGRVKRNRIMTAEEDDSDIVYIGSWTPASDKTRTKNIARTAVKIENVPVKLENLVPDLNLSSTAVKSEHFEIKLEDDQVDRKLSIDEMMGNYDTLERRKEELKNKLAVKIKAQQREIDELLQRLDV